MIEKFLKNVNEQCNQKIAKQQDEKERIPSKVILITIFENNLELSVKHYFRKKIIIGFDTC